MPPTPQAIYYDGKTSEPRPISIHLVDRFLRIDGIGIELTVPLDDCHITPPLGSSVRLLNLPDNGQCELHDTALITMLEARLNANQGLHLVHGLESHWKTVLGGVVGLVIFVWLFLRYGIPLLADKAAMAVPPQLNAIISHQTLDFLDARYLQPSKLDASRIVAIEALFDRVINVIDADGAYQLEFRHSPMLGPNAFALPSGQILVTDAMVNLVKDDRQLEAVLAHEVNHVQQRHGLRSVFHHAGVFLIVAALVGDVASITSAAAALPAMLAETGYMRRFEQEADHAAGIYCLQQGWDTAPMQQILQLLDEQRPDFPVLPLLSTHPETRERLRRLQQQETRISTGIERGDTQSPRSMPVHGHRIDPPYKKEGGQ